MKTLIVLAALASIALAAPTLQEDGFETIHRVPDWHIQHPGISEPVKREKKSTSDLTTGTILHTIAQNPEIHNDAGTPSLVGRSTTSKKPLIVKKKFGYRLYRDSEEEKAHADSHESCGRQVKVKLCDEDGKFREMLRSSDHETSNIHTSADDMKLSIKMAKEAVENLQRDLMKMESRNAAMKMAHDSESDADLHEDIEVARQALEHIHTNFGDLETMSLHATASRDSEALHDVHITVAKSEEEKIAQWKEAMANIQKNVEIARNIEDSFKFANQQDNLSHLDQFHSASINNEHQLKDIDTHLTTSVENHMRGVETTHLNIETAEKEQVEQGLSDKTTTEHFNSNHAREEQHLEDDMNHSATEAVEMKAIDINNHHTLRSENHELHEQEKSADVQLEKHETGTHNIEPHVDTLTDSSLIKHQILSTEKEAEEQMKMKLDDNIALLKTSETEADNDKTSSINTINALTSDAVDQQQRTTQENELHGKHNHHKHHENTAAEIEDLADLHAKSVTHTKDDQNDADEDEPAVLWSMLPSPDDGPVDTKPKDATTGIETEEKENYTKMIQDLNLHKLNNAPEQFDNSMKSATPQEQIKLQKIDYNDSDTEHVAALNGMKSAEQHLHHHLPSLKSVELPMHHHIPSMKSVEHNLPHHMSTMKSADIPVYHHIMSIDSAESHLHHLETVPTNGLWAQEQMHVAPKEATEEFHRKDFDGIDHMMNPHLAEHRYVPNKMQVTHDFEMSQHPHQHVPMGYHHKTHDISSMSHGAYPSKFYPRMRDAMEGFGSEHMYRWAPTHEYRNAYGSGISGSIGGSIGGAIGSSGGGAVGVFPNANTGGCGIPLLLSCSPSVVSGSLAKAHPSGQGSSYGGSSYRTEEDFGFHNKRDIKKTNEMRSTTVLRTPTIIKQKTGTMLENQL